EQSAMPVVGFLNPASSHTFADRLRAFRQGLKGTGYAEGENVAIVYRWAENQIGQLTELAVELVHRKVALIVAFVGAALAAKAATTTIPIVFLAGDDPVRLGLVASLARPGGNATGINVLSGELVAKRLELLRELEPGATRVAVLVNPTDAESSESQLRELEAAAGRLGLQKQVLKANTSRDIDAAYATFERERPDALFITGDPFFTSRRVQLANLAARHMVPITSSTREIAEAGGLMSYGSNIAEAWRQVGVYTGRILKGAKPADLPVVQVTKLELVINAQTARMLRLTVPSSLLATADEVLE
ncbi:MAG: ABC transporter substrate-binding protein, partial [Xanthobacteraceae bacterium]